MEEKCVVCGAKASGLYQQLTKVFPLCDPCRYDAVKDEVEAEMAKIHAIELEDIDLGPEIPADLMCFSWYGNLDMEQHGLDKTEQKRRLNWRNRTQRGGVR
jgi:hypothetical protein